MTLTRRWLPFVPVVIAVLVLFTLFVPKRPSTPVGEFVLPARNSGRPVQALYRIQAIATQAGWTPDMLRLAGDLWREAGDFARALAYWQSAAEEQADERLLRDIAEMALELGDWTSANDALQQLRASLPNDPWVNLQLALLRAVVNPSAAIEYLGVAETEPAYAALANDLIAVLPQSADDSVNGLAVGQVLAEHELLLFAETAFMQAATEQALPEAMAYAGFVRDRQGKDGSAWVEQALRLAPNNPTVRLLQGLHLRQLGEDEGSLNALIGAVALDPENPVMYAELGTAYQLVGDLPQARRWLEQAVALSDDPRFQQLLDALAAEENQLLEAFGVATEEANAATAEPIP